MRCKAGMLGANRERLFNIAGARFVATLSTQLDTQPTGLFFKNDGSAMYVRGQSGDSVREYSLSTPWSISSASLVRTKVTSNNQYGVAFSTAGDSMFLADLDNTTVVQYSLSTNWDISSASLLQSFSTTGTTQSHRGIAFSTDGTEMYLVDGGFADAIDQYSLSIAWDISTAEYTRTLSVASQEGDVYGVHFKPDGLRMYITGTQGDEVNQYELSTPWDISTAVYSKNFSVASQEAFASGIFFSSNGDKMYVTGFTNSALLAGKVHEYSLI